MLRTEHKMIRLLGDICRTGFLTGEANTTRELKSMVTKSDFIKSLPTIGQITAKKRYVKSQAKAERELMHQNSAARSVMSNDKWYPLQHMNKKYQFSRRPAQSRSATRPLCATSAAVYRAGVALSG
jgi:hypothetical protein